ncbi:hypothetical protein LTR78_000450 [Recurvomyces mirabilis]|uniref:Uncharacterized protein n=1 Tax=Recurvomyces mirabilis TaxID=574656 RepID=A0AAE1C6M0_9PEZI|nr:hypothetical protein LTR78_000450 [Recurvomyces mirabilis]KAK5162105.1 hypothetical protein LTS14_000451 [Recurvomyces mirabilis]
MPPAGAIPVPPHDWLPGQAIYDEPIGHHVVDPIATVLDDTMPFTSLKPKKGKTVKYSEPVPTSYKGYFLRKDPLPGQKPHWGRVGKRDIGLDSAKLLQMARLHLKGRTGALETAYNNLTSSQQGVVNNVRDVENGLERNANAEWVLADVHRYGPERFGNLTDVTKIGVILRRQDKQKGMIDTKTTNLATTYYGPDEIIDLQAPTQGTKEKSGKANGRKNSSPLESIRRGRSPDIFDPVNMNMNPFDEPIRHHQPVQQPWPETMAPPPAPMVPQYPDPVAAMGGHPGPPPPMPPQNFNPFQPFPGVMEPPLHGPMYNHHDHRGPRALTPIPDPTRLRRNSSAKRLSRVENENRRLEAEVDELRDRMEAFPIGSNSSGASARDRARDRFEAWSGTGGSRTPQSSPPRSEDLFYEEGRRKHSRDRNGGRRNERQYRGERRDGKYRTNERVEVRAHAAGRPRRLSGRDYDRDEYDGRRSPPRLQRAHTSDYPLGSIGDRREPRYIAQQPQLRRQLTDYPDAVPYAEYTTTGRRRGGQASSFDPMAEMFQAGRRAGRNDGHYDGRRSEFVEADRDYYH